MKNKLQIIIPAIIALAIISLIYLGITGNSVKDYNNDNNVIKIGWTGPLTGQAAVLGFDSVTAAEIAINEINQQGGINNKNLKLIVEDDQYDVKKTVDAYNKLVNIDKVNFILINTYSGVFALAEQAKKDNVILIDPLDCNSEISNLNDNVFCLATDTESIGIVLANEANKRNKKIAIIYFNSDRFMPLVKEFFQKNYKGEIIASESITKGTTDFKTILTKILNKNAEGIVLLGYDEMGIAMKQARDLGFKGQFYMPGTVTSPGLQESAKGNAEGTILAFWNADKEKEPTKSFTSKFIDIKGRPPILDLATYPSYDTIKVIAIALENSKSNNLDDIKKELLNVKGYKGVTGNIDFNVGREMSIRESAFILKNSKPVLIQQ